MTSQPRVALFCETFHEINGVALTARQLVGFAKRRARPFLTVLGGPRLCPFPGRQRHAAGIAPQLG
jgi:hypothetical protein